MRSSVRGNGFEDQRDITLKVLEFSFSGQVDLGFIDIDTKNVEAVQVEWAHIVPINLESQI